jgi:hypothetical protein
LGIARGLVHVAQCVQAPALKPAETQGASRWFLRKQSALFSVVPFASGESPTGRETQSRWGR